MFKLQRFLPCEALRDFIDTYYLLEIECAPGEALDDLMLPELANARFQLEGQWQIGFKGQGFKPAPSSNVFGFTHAPWRVHVGGRTRVFGAGIKPLGWMALIGLPACTLADDMCHAADIWGEGVEDTRRVLSKATCGEDMAAILDRLLLSRRRSVLPMKQTALMRFIDVLERPETAEINRVDDLAYQLGLSVRQVERSTQEFFGCSPKLLLRQHRFLSMLSRNLDGAASQSWLDSADESFYDQSHYIREYKRFTGRSPQQFAKSSNKLQRHVAHTLSALSERTPSRLGLKLDLAQHA
jgi:AraC-like DNA-binding protein